MNKTLIKGYIFIILSAVIFGCMPLMTNYVYTDGVNPLSLVLFRNIISLPALAALAFFSAKSLRIAPRSIPSVFIIGILGTAVTPFLLFNSYKFMESGTATVFHFIYPAAVMLLEMCFLKCRVRWGNLISLALCIAGIAMFYTPGSAINTTGSIMALSSGVTYALYIVLLGAFKSEGTDGFLFGFYATVGSTVAIVFGCLITGEVIFPASAQGWIFCIMLALLVNVGAIILFQQGTFIIGGERAAILSTFEPITSIIVGTLAFGEKVGALTVIGAVLVLSASILIAVIDSKRNKE